MPASENPRVPVAPTRLYQPRWAQVVLLYRGTVVSARSTCTSTRCLSAVPFKARYGAWHEWKHPIPSTLYGRWLITKDIRRATDTSGEGAELADHRADWLFARGEDGGLCWRIPSTTPSAHVQCTPVHRYICVSILALRAHVLCQPPPHPQFSPSSTSISTSPPFPFPSFATSRLRRPHSEPLSATLSPISRPLVQLVCLFFSLRPLGTHSCPSPSGSLGGSLWYVVANLVFPQLPIPP